MTLPQKYAMLVYLPPETPKATALALAHHLWAEKLPPDLVTVEVPVATYLEAGHDGESPAVKMEGLVMET